MAWYQRHKARRSTKAPTLTPAHCAYLEEAGALLELPRQTVQALLPLYIAILDDMVPLVDGPRLLRDWSNGTASRYLVRAVCLAVSKSPQAASFLWLEDPSHDSKPLLALDFASHLLSGLDAALKSDLEPDRINRVRILALMHLHTDGPGGLDRSLCLLSQAISEAWCLSLHHPPPASAAGGAAADSDEEGYALLWWTLRHLDRLNKPITGAGPFIIDDSNAGISRIEPGDGHWSYKAQVACVATSLGDLMVHATKVYKPNIVDMGDLCHDFPGLETLVGNFDLQTFHSAHRAYFEIWYHVAAMLSCRFSAPGTAPYTRRLSSADQVLGIVMGQQVASMVPLPLVPYAMSMCTTVIYRALRDKSREYNQALADLRQCSGILNELGACWTSVRGICKLAKKICSTTAPVEVMGADADAINARAIDQSALRPGPGIAATAGDAAYSAASDPTMNLTDPNILPDSTLLGTAEVDLVPAYAKDDTWASHMDPSSYFLMDSTFHLDFNTDMFSILMEDPALQELAPFIDDSIADSTQRH
ncbi:hypothetical protein Micbo1qcDRAFT_203655 [Microdochium bolleyi]|uniref:Transcription factor domain-containing protein n=1 Tax=Microdochium bolleyi TaxID=196109 RepID=A0A136J8T5_9PEZI|nr:hypothetical protein Micbo1qcDRAFT_203655 [Microdochium bolleyi]